MGIASSRPCIMPEFHYFKSKFKNRFKMQNSNSRSMVWDYSERKEMLVRTWVTDVPGGPCIAENAEVTVDLLTLSLSKTSHETFVELANILGNKKP